MLSTHEFRMNVKPPAMMPPKDKAKSLPDNQAPIIPPEAMLASNQKIQIARLFIGDRPLGRSGGSDRAKGIAK
jgi:hypothetical protein